MSKFLIAVIADDLSGAAELAGIAFLHGLTAEVQTRFEPASDAQVIAVDTDSRGLSAAEGAAKVREVALEIAAARPAMIFKKVDSVLRGNARAEIEAILAATGLQQAVLVPANPSRGRTIDAGRYLIGGVPLHETEFAHDPVHPRRSANVAALLGGSVPAIAVPDVRDLGDVDCLARCLPENTLAAGAADLFTAILRQRGLCHAIAAAHEVQLAAPAALICGSLTAWKMRESECARADLPIVSFHPTREVLVEQAAQVWKSRGVLAVAADGALPSALRSEMFDRFTAAASDLICQLRPATVLAEGGATAAALARHLGWSRLATVAAAPAGVGVLRPLASTVSPLLLIKPGSYPWPAAIWRQFAGLR